MALAQHPQDLAALHERARAAYPAFLHDLRHLVEIDSGTYTKSGVDQVSAWMMDQLKELGASVVNHPHAEFGDTCVATFERSASGPTIILLGHADTVFEPGTVRARPFRVSADRAFGPGVADMKSGLLCGLYALSILRRETIDIDAWLPVGRLIFVVDSDEEIGSPSSTPIIEALAGDADIALVLEGARPNGAIVTARAGMMHLRIVIEGRAAHAGVEPEKGRSAVLEAARLAVALAEMERRWEGVTVNVGQLHGGTRPNIVAAEATLTLDVRATSAAEQDEVEAAVRDLVASPTVQGTKSSVEILARSRPMERSSTSAGLMTMGRDVSAALGFELGEVSSRGASDGNTTAGVGVPTLDGLGAVGGERHARAEYIELATIVPRTAWLAAMLTEIGRDVVRPPQIAGDSV